MIYHDNKDKITHGLTNTPTYSSYKSMKQRCENKNNPYYKYYGGRGISICDCIKSVEDIVKKIGLRPSLKFEIERIDNDRNYCICENNLKWATRKEQSTNKRLRKDNDSGLRGVYLRKNCHIKKWYSEIKIDKKKIHLGAFESKFEASDAFLEKYYSHYKKFPPEYKPIRINHGNL